MTQRYVVVGAGLAGSATAWSLARRGHEVILLEQTSPANEYGSSHGSARILRHRYADAFYSRLVGAAREYWNRLESVAGTSLIRTTGALDFGDVRGPRQLANVLSQVGVEHELITARSPLDQADRAGSS